MSNQTQQCANAAAVHVALNDIMSECSASGAYEISLMH